MIDLFKRLDELKGKNPAGIYLLEINNKQYVGSSINLKSRLRKHRTMLRTKKHSNKHLQNLYNKYKVCSYKILEEVSNKIKLKDLRIIEREWIIKLNPETNIDDPLLGIGGHISKQVHQYDLKGNFIKSWDSCMIAAREMDLNYGSLHQAANPKAKSKTAYGFMWSYEKKKNINPFVNNTGSNLLTREVHLYKLNGDYYKSFKSLSDCARYVSKIINFKKDWKQIRSAVAYVLQNPKTRKLRRRYLVSYVKAENFNSLSQAS